MLRETVRQRRKKKMEERLCRCFKELFIPFDYFRKPIPDLLYFFRIEMINDSPAFHEETRNLSDQSIVKCRGYVACG